MEVPSSPHMLQPKPLTHILVKPSGPDCNLNCTYCFYHHKSFRREGDHELPKQRRMTVKVLERLIRQAMRDAAGGVSFGWQGGEPTLMGLPFFQKAVDLQIKYGRGQLVGNGFQTNGILLNDEWARFFSQYHFLVGLSIDGPQHVHDHYRRYPDGRSTFSLVDDARKRLLDHGVAVNALTVVNSYSVQFAEEIYEFHKSRGLNYMQFIPCVEADPRDPAQPAAFSVPAEQYGIFLCRIFDLWLADFADNRPTTSIRFFDSLFHSYVDKAPPDCSLLPSCGVYVVVEANGDVYPCDFFVEDDWRLGKIMESSLITLLNSPRQNEFGAVKSVLPEACRTCAWLEHCHGGCVKDRLRLPHNKKQNYLCEAYRIFFRHADPVFRKLADRWRNERR